MSDTAGTASTTGGLTQPTPNPDIVPPENVTPPNPNAPTPPENPAGDPPSDEKKEEDSDGEQKVSLSQKELDELIKKRLEQQKRQFETAAQKAERERQEAKAEEERQKQEEQDRLEQEKLAEKQEFQKLAEKAQGTVKTLTSERDTLRKQVSDLEAKVTAGEEALKVYLDAEMEGVPEHLVPLLERMEVPDRLRYLTENRNHLKPPTAPAGTAPKQAAPVPPTPKAEEAAVTMTEAQRQEALAATARHYKQGVF